MKRKLKTQEYLRMEELIRADKSVMSEACRSLVLQDFAEKFNEYFDLVGLPRMEIVCQNGSYTVAISFSAERIKKFNVLK